RLAEQLNCAREDCFADPVTPEVQKRRNHPPFVLNSERLQVTKTAKEGECHEYDHHGRRKADLLQGLGHRADSYVLSRLASERGRLGWPNFFSGAARFPSRRA